MYIYYYNYRIVCYVMVGHCIKIINIHLFIIMHLCTIQILYISMVLIIYQSYIKGVINNLHTCIHLVNSSLHNTQILTPLSCICNRSWFNRPVSRWERYIYFGINMPNMSMHTHSSITKQHVQTFLIHYSFQAVDFAETNGILITARHFGDDESR